MKVKIVNATIDDTSDFFDRENKCFGYKVRFDKEKLYSRLDTLIMHGYSYKAVHKKKIVGHVTSFITRTGDLFVDYLCVDVKRKGIGTLLLKKLRTENPRKTIYLFTDHTNISSMLFYLKSGFVFDKREKDRIYFVL